MIDGNNYKAVRKELGLSPKEWDRIQAQNALRKRKHYGAEYQIRIFQCACGSAFCEHCVGDSQSFQRILEIMSTFDWRCVRNVMLSIDRERFKTPAEAYERIKANREINKFIKRVDTATGRKNKYLWVIEFHADGFPHYHVLLDSGVKGQEGMIGKEIIQNLWGFGHCWESYIKDESHWKAIQGYGKKKGYFGGENKRHQMFPPVCISTSQTSIRKFGSNVSPKKEDSTKIKSTNRRKVNERVALKERLLQCCKTQKVQIVGKNWRKVKGSYRELSDWLASVMTKTDFNSFITDDIERIIEIDDTLNMQELCQAKKTKEG